ncbi:MAG: LacI family DNA-binding transcriptional regulator [Lachnospiraceae bacterium]|uniref:LacI family DNA-binding transcriptional regulator n=1 Tax=Parablautia sp. Marseille-Q6255 TaxID=3039593 RepID=UPI0024BBED00|nr:LacI family DNA-binding transcriptional regulator [Parablautia sp. Marseille-Q6255]
MAGIREVAAYAGVGVGTVSRALNKTGYVSEETRKKIEEAVKVLNYQPNELARNLYRNKSGVIGVIVPDLENPFFAKFMKYTEMELFRYGYRALVCNTIEISNRVEELIDLMEKNVMDGLIVGVDPPSEKILKRVKKPIVSMDRNWGKGIPIITSDNKKGAQLIADQIIQAGCKKILTLEGKTYIHHPFEERGLGMKQILNKNGISVISAEVEWNVLSYEYYMWIVEKYLDLFDDVDAVYAGDLLAVACMAVVKKRGIRVPEDLKIIGYDGLDLGKLVSPPLTTVKQDIPKMAKCCVDTIMRLLDGDTHVEEKQVCDVELIKGGTI